MSSSIANAVDKISIDLVGGKNKHTFLKIYFLLVSVSKRTRVDVGVIIYHLKRS